MPEMKDEKTAVIANQKSWLLEHGSVSCCVTRRGGHMAPVEFCVGSGESIRPYYISPWQTEPLQLTEPVLIPLRGDFFCMPFGENNAYQGETHAVHGEPAGAIWSFVSLEAEGSRKTLHARLETRGRQGSVDKRITVQAGQDVLYIQHTVNGFAGKTTLGHHATLHGEQEWLISTSPIQFGMVNPGTPLQANGEYSSLLPGSRFSDLRAVPTVWKTPDTSDCTVFPAREGFVDIAQVYFETSEHPVWTTAVNREKGYLWFSLKDQRVLPSMVLWMENHGRHGEPWFGRNCCIGLEDVCGYFAQGLAASAEPNPVNLAGIPTVHDLPGDKPFAVNMIEGVARIPAGFGRVKQVEFREGEVCFIDEHDVQVVTAVDHRFVFNGGFTE